MSDAVARLNAALEGRYAIERELGEGGMATVYLADDLACALPDHSIVSASLGNETYTVRVESNGGKE